MMNQNLPGECRMSLLDRRGDQRRRAARWYGSAAVALALPFTGPVPRRGERHATPLAAIRRIVRAIRLWRRRARAHWELHELGDHTLKDIGLRREDFVYGFRKPLWHLD